MPDTYTPNLNLKKPGYDSPADIKDLNDNFDKIDTSVNQLSQQMVDYRTAVNLFDNGDFLIAQNGYGGVHGNTPYAADRWCMVAGLTVSHDGVGLTITKPTSLAWYSGFRQTVDIKHLKGKHVTMVAYCKTSNRMRFYAWGRDSDEDIHLSFAHGNNSEDGVYTASVAIPSSLSDDYVTFSFAPDCDNTGAPVSKLRMALYPRVYDAKTVPPYVPKGYAVELAGCMRYVYVEKPATGYETPFAYGYSNGSFCRVIKTIPVPQRLSKPSIHSDGITWSVMCNGQQYPVTGMYVMESSGNRYMIQVEAAGMAVGHLAALICSGDGNIVIESNL